MPPKKEDSTKKPAAKKISPATGKKRAPTKAAASTKKASEPVTKSAAAPGEKSRNENAPHQEANGKHGKGGHPLLHGVRHCCHSRRGMRVRGLRYHLLRRTDADQRVARPIGQKPPPGYTLYVCKLHF